MACGFVNLLILVQQGSSHSKSTETITITENNKRLQYKTCAYTEAATNIKRLRFQGSYLISPGGRRLKDYPSSEKNAMSQTGILMNSVSTPPNQVCSCSYK